MSNPFLRDIIPQDEEYSFLPNYYACHQLAIGDVVLYRISPLQEPVVRIVRAVAGSKFQLVPHTGVEGGWLIEIDGNILMSGDRPHFFGATGLKPLLHTYQEERNGVLREGEILIFSSWPPGNEDSATLGVLSVQDVLGKIDLSWAQRKRL